MFRITLAAAFLASPAWAEGWEPIRNAETGKGAVVCTDDFAQCFGLRCVAGRGTEFFVMLAGGAEAATDISLRVDDTQVAAKSFEREDSFGDLVAPYGGESDAALIQALRTGSTVRLAVAGDEFAFSLKGSGKAIDGTLEACR